MRTVSSSIRNAPVPGRARQNARQESFDSPIGALTPSQKAMWDGMNESERELTKLFFHVPDADVKKIDLLGKAGVRQPTGTHRRKIGIPRYVNLAEEEGGEETASEEASAAVGSFGGYGPAEYGGGQNKEETPYAGNAPAAAAGTGTGAVSGTGGTDAAYRDLLLRQAEKDPSLYSNPNFLRELKNAEQRMEQDGDNGAQLADSYSPARYWREGVGSIANAGQNILNALSTFGKEMQAGQYASSAMDQRFLGRLTGQEEAYNDRADSLLALSMETADRALEPATDFGSRYQAETERLYPYTGPARNFLNRVIRGTASMAPSIVGNLLAPGSGLYINMLQCVGGAMREAKERGADDSTALAYGASVGIAETLLEKLMDGLGGALGSGVLDRMIGDEVRKAAVSPAAQEALIYLGGMVGEGFEEFLSVFTDELLNVHMLGTTAQTWEALLKEGGLSFFSGMLVSGLIQGASRLGVLVDAGADDLTVEDLARELAAEVEERLRESPEEADTGEPDLAGEAEVFPEAEYLPETEPVAEPTQENLDFDMDSAKNPAYTQKQRRQRQVRVNYFRGTAFGKRALAYWDQFIASLSGEIMLVVPSGTRMRADAIGLFDYDRTVIFEFKSSETAPLTDNQKQVFKELQEHEAHVVGKGKGIFKGGTIIKPVSEGTRIIIYRPNHWEDWNVDDTR